MSDRLNVRGVLRRVEAIEDWSLTDAEWRAVGAALEALAGALDTADDAGVRAALGTLQEVEEARRALARPGPVRTYIPQQQREQRNILVRRLTLDLNRESAVPPPGAPPAPGQSG
ncbi:CATRA system-associated protein [Actinacidiphila alni]|uniref:CATRA system-associated protein n=1 Tax=Actinacidiphila alni TaxID=380248 RepID=UPI003451C77E